MPSAVPMWSPTAHANLEVRDGITAREQLLGEDVLHAVDAVVEHLPNTYSIGYAPHLGIADGMSIAGVWACRYSK